MSVLIQDEPFDPGHELNNFSSACKGAGAIVSFTGVVRDVDECLLEMKIEHYPKMTEKAISSIVLDAKERWSLIDALVIHRFGSLKPNDEIMMVATASKHRADAFAAADFLMDYLKSRAPFWKKEHTKKASEWVAATIADEDALKKWR